MQLVGKTLRTAIIALLLPGALAVWAQQQDPEEPAGSSSASGDSTASGAPSGSPPSTVDPVRQPGQIPDIPIIPGPETAATDGRSMQNPYAGDQKAIQEGRRLFGWYNCAGCHAPKGGGGMGPPLSDARWIYGDAPQSVFDSIWEGRPNGMPTWAARIPPDEVWKVVAYIQTLPGELPDFAPQDQADEQE